MTAGVGLPAALAGTEPIRPGHCSDHPNQPLVTHRQAGQRYWGVHDPAVVCVMCIADGNLDGRLRCVWCGGRLVPPGTPSWSLSERRAYCSPLHRLQAFRARQRASGGGTP